MKLSHFIYRMYETIAGADRIRMSRLLHQHQQLLYTGIEVPAEVIDISFIKKGTGALHLIRLWIKLKKKDDSFVYTHTQAFVTSGNLPQKGQWLRIKYSPENFSLVLVI